MLLPVKSLAMQWVPFRIAGRVGTSVADASHSHWSAMSVCSHQLREQRLDAVVNLVADPAHRRERFAGRIFEVPVQVALAWIERAGIAAAHGDDHVRSPDHLVGERLRELLADVQT